MKYKAEDVGNLLNTAERVLEITEIRLEDALKAVRIVRNAFLSLKSTCVEIESEARKAKKRKAKTKKAKR